MLREGAVSTAIHRQLAALGARVGQFAISRPYGQATDMREGEWVAGREHSTGVGVQRVQIPRDEPGAIEDGFRLVQRSVGPERECRANDPCFR